MTGGAGIDAVSSAQSKRVGAGVGRGGTGLKGGGTRDGSRKTAAAAGSGTLANVKGTGSGETARLRASWGEPGRIASERGCFDESGSVRRRSRGVARVPEGARAGDTAVVDDDVVAERGGSRRGTGVLGMSWSELGRMGSERGASLCVDVVVGDEAAVCDAGGVADDVAAVVGSGCGTRGCGLSWGELGGVGRLLGLRLWFWGE